MMKTPFFIGPFDVSLCGAGAYDVAYGSKVMARGIYAPGVTRQAVADALADCRARLAAELRERAWSPARIWLCDSTGERITCFVCADPVIDGMTAGLADDRAAHWLISDDRLYSMPVQIDRFASIAQRHAAPTNGWIAELLDPCVVTADPDAWRPPAAWEIRHVVGEGSFTGLSGGAAARLVGISPQNFRKYTASEGAKGRQPMSYAIWHLLLQRAGITHSLTVWDRAG